jgi:hypothetical protein
VKFAVRSDACSPFVLVKVLKVLVVYESVGVDFTVVPDREFHGQSIPSKKLIDNTRKV